MKEKKENRKDFEYFVNLNWLISKVQKIIDLIDGDIIW